MASFCEALQPALSELRRRAFGIAPQLSFCLTFYLGKHTSVIENSIDFFLAQTDSPLVGISTHLQQYTAAELSLRL